MLVLKDHDIIIFLQYLNYGTISRPAQKHKDLFVQSNEDKPTDSCNLQTHNNVDSQFAIQLEAKLDKISSYPINCLQ